MPESSLKIQGKDKKGMLIAYHSKKHLSLDGKKKLFHPSETTLFSTHLWPL